MAKPADVVDLKHPPKQFLNMPDIRRSNESRKNSEIFISMLLQQLLPINFIFIFLFIGFVIFIYIPIEIKYL